MSYGSIRWPANFTPHFINKHLNNSRYDYFILILSIDIYLFNLETITLTINLL